jgi:hypothetical protein
MNPRAICKVVILGNPSSREGWWILGGEIDERSHRRCGGWGQRAAPRRARGFQSASGVFRSMMLLVGVIVVGEVCNVWSKTLKNGQKTITNFLIVLISFASRVGLKK